MRIRPAGDDDQELVARMRLEFLADVRDTERFSEAIATGTREFIRREHATGTLLSWLAEDGNGTCAGLVSLVLHRVPPHPEHPGTTEGFVVNMYVVPAARKQGLGQLLLDACLAEARSRQLRRIVLHATEAGRPLYERAGFRPDKSWMQLTPLI